MKYVAKVTDGTFPSNRAAEVPFNFQYLYCTALGKVREPEPFQELFPISERGKYGNLPLL